MSSFAVPTSWTPSISLSVVTRSVIGRFPLTCIWQGDNALFRSPRNLNAFVISHIDGFLATTDEAVLTIQAHITDNKTKLGACDEDSAQQFATPCR